MLVAARLFDVTASCAKEIVVEARLPTRVVCTGRMITANAPIWLCACVQRRHRYNTTVRIDAGATARDCKGFSGTSDTRVVEATHASTRRASAISVGVWTPTLDFAASPRAARRLYSHESSRLLPGVGITIAWRDDAEPARRAMQRGCQVFDASEPRAWWNRTFQGRSRQDCRSEGQGRALGQSEHCQTTAQRSS